MKREDIACDLCGEDVDIVPEDPQQAALCVECRKRFNGFEPSERAGQVIGNISGVDKSGKVPDGGDPWNWRPPEEASERATIPIVLGNQLFFQRPPTVHPKTGASYRPRPGPRRRKLGLTEREAGRRALLEVAAQLTPEQRDVFLLQADGYKYPEIAGKLGISITTVRERMRRARERLRAAATKDESA